MTTTINALRAILPLAEARAVDARQQARVFAAHGPSPTAAHYAECAEAATSAVTAARLAIQDAEAAAHHVSLHAAYDVTFASCGLGAGRVTANTHCVRVMAECADDAQARAIAACEAAGVIHGDVLHVCRA